MKKPEPSIALSIVVATAACVAILGVSGLGVAQDAGQKPAPKTETQFSPYVDKEGRISLPKDYKTKWVHLGDWAVAKKKGDVPHELHEVYTPPGVIESFEKTGEFPDGAVLVKEVRKTKSAKMTTGHVTWADDIKIWFVMIKDKNKRFPESDIWGDGWGWALFEAKDPNKNTTTNYRASCIGCHIPAENTDWVFVQGYRKLKRSN